VVCALLMMYACGQRNDAEKQYRIGEELRMQAERTRQECQKTHYRRPLILSACRLKILKVE